MKCLRCGAELRAGTSFCAECGYRIPDRQKTAGSSVKPDGTYRYVPNRGTAAGTVPNKPPQSKPPQDKPPQSNPPQSKPVQTPKVPSGPSKLGNFFRGLFKYCFRLMITCLVGGILAMLVSELPELPSKILDKKESDRSTQTTQTTQTTQPTQPTMAAVTEYKPSTRTDYVFYSIRELKNTLAPDCVNEHLDVTVHYKGNQEEIRKIADGQVLGGRSGGISEIEPEVYRVVAYPYSGSKMLKAYRTGDHSNLTEDERKALSVAESVVSAARKEANSDMELELWLHDWMCRNISYYDVDFSIEFTDRRQLNAVGALLDGKANCQGYTDCFYLLGNMAGFVVDRQVVPGHIFNTIKLGGSWYIVDVTHDDWDDIQMGEEVITYRFLNVGKDYSDGRSWEPEQERQPVSEVSTSYFYYFQKDSKGYNKLYDSMDVLAGNVLYANRSGDKTFHGMLLGGEYTHEELFAAVDAAAKKQRVGYDGYYVRSDSVPGNTIYSIVFE